MALSTQFSLSLELNRFIPWREITEMTIEACGELTKDLKSSGSSMVDEESLVKLFGGLGASYPRTFCRL